MEFQLPCQRPVCTLREVEAWAFRLTKNKRGVIIQNSEFLQVQQGVQALTRVGIQVQYYLISRE